MGSPVGGRERVARGVDVGNGGCFSDMPTERGLRVLHSRSLKACRPVPSFFGMEGMKGVRMSAQPREARSLSRPQCCPL